MGACATKPKVAVDGEAPAPAPASLEEKLIVADAEPTEKTVEADVITVAGDEPEQPDSSRSRSLSFLLKENEEIGATSETEIKETIEEPKAESEVVAAAELVKEEITSEHPEPEAPKAEPEVVAAAEPVKEEITSDQPEPAAPKAELEEVAAAEPVKEEITSEQPEPAAPKEEPEVVAAIEPVKKVITSEQPEPAAPIIVVATEDNASLKSEEVETVKVEAPEIVANNSVEKKESVATEEVVVASQVTPRLGG